MSNKVLISDVPRSLTADNVRAPFVIDESMHIADNMRQLEFDAERIGQIADVCGYTALRFWGYYGKRTTERFDGYSIDNSLMPKWVLKRKNRADMLNFYPSPQICQVGLSFLPAGMTMNTEINFNAIPAEIQRLTRTHDIKPEVAFELLYGDILDESIKEMVRSQYALIGVRTITEYSDDEPQISVEPQVGYHKRNLVERLIVNREISRIMDNSDGGELVSVRPRD
jgi:hypothetical protein